ncbi:MAG TPA: PEP-CTERM sorting domain-containing protein, partial [Phycisphaerales bacterium]|nr:PEP-CTERM sorting domain-containing protein [Phycisphaerales bacterium]
PTANQARLTGGAFSAVAAGTPAFANLIVVGQHGTIIFDELDVNTQEHIFTTVSVIPEPMTMGLLGLGALFLRRRK